MTAPSGPSNMAAFAFLVCTAPLAAVSFSLPLDPRANGVDLLSLAGDAVRDLLEYTSVVDYSLILITDASLPPYWDTFREPSTYTSPHGESFFKAASTAGEGEEPNATNDLLEHLLPRASELSRTSRLPVVMVASEDLSFLKTFAEESLKWRPLRWDTRLIIVTRENQDGVDRLMSHHWTFAMMDTMILHLTGLRSSELSCDIYTYLPYSSEGGQLVKVATWRKGEGVLLSSNLGPFPAKFANFYGSRVPITALPFPPYWIEKKISPSPQNDSEVTYSGTDYYLLDAVAKTLNFSIEVLKTDTWLEVARKVELRESFMAPVFHNVLPKRLERYDFSFVYEYGSLDFSFSKPQVKPQWQSLYYPLTYEVWSSTLVALLLMPAVFYGVNCIHNLWSENAAVNAGRCLQDFLAILLGQSLHRSSPRSHSSRAVVSTWMLFSFIIGTAYRGNLIAFLTLPSFPLRPETIKDLVQVADKITMPPYGAEFKEFFGKSDSEVFSSLSRLMHIVPNVLEGQRQALQLKQGHLDTRRYQELHIAQKFTKSDGSSQLYIGRESIIPGQSAWPIPHDAPYREALDWCIMAVLEAGLYEKWNQDLLRETRSEARRRLLLESQTEDLRMEVDRGDTGVDTKGKMALTLIHIQGPIFLLVFGLFTGFVLFSAEVFVKALFDKTEK